MVYSAALPLGNAVSVLSGEDSVVDMIGKYFFQLASPGQRLNPSRRGSVESCDERDSTTPVPDLEDCPEDELRLVHHDVTRQMERCLTEAKASVLNCQVLLLPRHMIPRVTADVLRSSVHEPCGLRGASIMLYLEGKEGLMSAGSIFPDPSVTPTFELSVVFRLDEDDGWPPPLRHFFDTKVLKLRPEYRLVKRKLYSSASPVVHDFS